MFIAPVSEETVPLWDVGDRLGFLVVGRFDAADEGALDRLAEQHPEKTELVKLRYFAGLTADQAAAAMGISPSTADRHWNYARAWLRRAMTPGGGAG